SNVPQTKPLFFELFCTVECLNCQISSVSCTLVSNSESCEFKPNMGTWNSYGLGLHSCSAGRMLHHQRSRPSDEALNLGPVYLSLLTMWSPLYWGDQTQIR
uniref:Uncharacterized protein n=1 Tax=Callorhinchus milii TaxID=7868 RepID=A0A4W3K905_CALMI